MTSKLLPGEPGGTILIATDGVRIDVIEDGQIPGWSSLHWYLTTDPTYRADWNRLRGYQNIPPNKLSKSE